MSITERDVVPCEDDREFLVECWKECLVKMLADVEETKRRWQDASQTVKAESLAAVADSRAAFNVFRCGRQAEHIAIVEDDCFHV